MVRLLHFKGTVLQYLRALFQSHNGAIAAHLIVVSLRRKFRVSIPQWCDCCYYRRALPLPHLRFQSHNGAIAAGTCHFESGDECHMFQSHNGAIAAELPFATLAMLPSFNPTMVRLLRKG